MRKSSTRLRPRDHAHQRERVRRRRRAHRADDPTTLSERTLEQLTRFLAEQTHAPTLLPFASMLDRRKRLQRDLVAHLTRDIPGFLQTAIPNASVIERMGVERGPVARFAPTSPATTAFGDLWAEIAARVRT